MKMKAVIFTDPIGSDKNLVEMLRGMLPLMRLYGIASQEEIGIDELAGKMQTEAAVLSPVVTLTPCIGAWSLVTSSAF
jgi:hypothetical protein